MWSVGVSISYNGKQNGDSGGLNWTESSIQTDSESMCFDKANLQISSECGTHSADKKAETLNLAFNPPFRQSDVVCSLYFFRVFIHFSISWNVFSEFSIHGKCPALSINTSLELGKTLCNSSAYFGGLLVSNFPLIIKILVLIFGNNF